MSFQLPCAGGDATFVYCTSGGFTHRDRRVVPPTSEHVGILQAHPRRDTGMGGPVGVLHTSAMKSAVDGFALGSGSVVIVQPPTAQVRRDNTRWIPDSYTRTFHSANPRSTCRLT